MSEKSVFFIYQHPEIMQNQSDGLALVVPDRLGETGILFYDQENDGLFSDCDNPIGPPVLEDFRVRPARLTEVCEQGYADLVDTIAEYTMKDGRLIEVRYIHLRIRTEES